MNTAPNNASNGTERNTPLFSIVTVTYNNEDGLSKTRQSILSQPRRHEACLFEWIIIDGASTGGTADILHDCPAHIISEPDQGIYDTMNKGIGHCRGQYAIFMNAGDIFAAPDTLAKLAADIAKLPAKPDFIYGDALEELDAAQTSLKPARKLSGLPHTMFTHHQAMLYRLSRLSDMQYGTGYDIAADYDLTVRFLMHTSNVHYCAFPICLFEKGGISQKNVTQARREQFTIRKKLKIVTPFQNKWISLRQYGASSLKRLAPALYWALRRRV